MKNSAPSASPKSQPWWGTFDFTEHPCQSWVLNDRSITIRRDTAEWKIWDHRSAQESMSQYCQQLPCRPDFEPSETLASDVTLIRLLQGPEENKLIIKPALADRFIVVSPSAALHLLPGEAATLYVSTPLWFTARTSENSKPVIDLPFWRPSDSWFGPSTREGEMCYAKYTDARLDLNLLEQKQHRAVTPVHVINQAEDVLAFERINIPVPLLTLYADTENQLWTNQLTLTLNDERDIEVDIAQVAPFDSLVPEPVNTPRTPSGKRTLMRNLSSLFA